MSAHAVVYIYIICTRKTTFGQSEVGTEHSHRVGFYVDGLLYLVLRIVKVNLVSVVGDNAFRPFLPLALHAAHVHRLTWAVDRPVCVDVRLLLPVVRVSSHIRAIDGFVWQMAVVPQFYVHRHRAVSVGVRIVVWRDVHRAVLSRHEPFRIGGVLVVRAEQFHRRSFNWRSALCVAHRYAYRLSRQFDCGSMQSACYEILDAVWLVRLR